MQAVIALCHFCESHGPRVVITCQPMRSLPNPVTSATPSGYERHAESTPLISRHRSDSPSTSKAAMEEPILPVYYGDCTRTATDSEDRCNACTSLGPQRCLLSNDHENKTSYVTSQVPLKEQVYERVKHACIRSLSCEIPVPSQDVLPSETQPLRISTNEIDPLLDIEQVRKSDGHVLFGDTETGFCLSYAFRIHDSKARGFLRLFSLLILTQDVSSLTTHHDFFLTALKKIKDSIQALAEATFHTEMEHDESSMRPEHASMAGRLPYGFLKRKVVIDPTRSLQALTGMADIWCDMHRCMMWTLRTQTLRFEDQLMEGVPTQDMLVMMEMEPSDIVELDLDQPNQAEQLKNLKHISLQLGKKDERDLELLLGHVISGGQIIIQSVEKALPKQFILAISNLLPIGCLKVNTFVEHYYPPSQHNMLGCTQPIMVPASTDVLWIRVVSDNENETSLLNCRFEWVRRPEPRIASTKLLKRYMQLLMDDEVHNNVLKATLQSTREEWMSRAKLLYQLEEQRQRDPNMASGDLIRLVRGCTALDRPVLTFWQCGLSKAYKNHVIATIDELRAMRERDNN